MERQQTGAKHAAITLKGINHNTHWLNCEDGECEEIINMRFRDGSWHIIQDKEQTWQYTHGCDLIHYHPLNDTESSTGEDTDFFYIGYKNDDGSQLIVAFLPEENYEIVLLYYCEEIEAFTHINNIMIAYGADGQTLYTFYWDYDAKEYVFLNTPSLPRMSLWRGWVDWDNPFHARQKNYQFDDVDHKFLADFPDYYSKVMDYTKNKREENEIVESYVIVVVAWRLWDGSFMMHSQPMICYCGKMEATYQYMSAGDVQAVERGYYDLHGTKPILMVDTENISTVKERWGGLIQGLTIFMTKPVSFYTYPQSREGYSWKKRSEFGVGDGWEAIDEGEEFMPWNKAIKDMVDDPIYYRVNEIPWSQIESDVTRFDITLGFNSENISKDLNYYLPTDNFTHNKLLSKNQYVFNRRLHQGQLTIQFGAIDTQLLTDYFFDETPLGSGYERMSAGEVMPDVTFWAEVTIKTDSGNRYVLQSFAPNVFQSIDQGDNREGSGSGSYSGSGSESGGGRSTEDEIVTIPFMPIVSYADPRATKLRILAEKNNVYYEIQVFTLRAHPFMTMAYYANYDDVLNSFVVTQDGEDPEYKCYKHLLVSVDNTPEEIIGGEADRTPYFDVTTIQTDNRYYLDENRLQVSRIDNPFVNEAKHSYQIGGQDSKIIGLATSSIQVSEGQYGEFPLFIFTNEGVYTLKQGIDPAILYSSISPVSKERLIPGTICEISQGIVYATSDGVKLLSGTSIKNLSDGIMTGFDNPLLANDEYNDLLDGTTINNINIYDYIDSQPFQTYLNGAKFAFDSYESELIVCNPDYNYSYIYNLKFNLWYKIDQTWDYFIVIPPKYYGVKDDALVDMEGTSGIIRLASNNILIQTKPIKLGSQGYKQISRIIIRQEIDALGGEESTSSELSMSADEGVYLFGSVDGTEWKLLRGVAPKASEDDQILRVVIPMPHVAIRYLIIVIAANARFMKFSHIELQYTDTLQNKLR